MSPAGFNAFSSQFQFNWIKNTYESTTYYVIKGTDENFSSFSQINLAWIIKSYHVDQYIQMKSEALRNADGTHYISYIFLYPERIRERDL